MSIEAIHHLLDAWNIPRLSSNGHVYDLRRHTWIPYVGTRRLHERQLEILRTIRALPWTVFLHYEESPEDWELEGRWYQEGKDTWVVPRDDNSSQLLSGYLNQGGWCLYLATDPLVESRMPHLFGMTPDQISDFTRSHSIPVFVQAYFDNAEWRIALEPAVVAVANAA